MWIWRLLVVILTLAGAASGLFIGVVGQLVLAFGAHTGFSEKVEFLLVLVIVVSGSTPFAGIVMLQTGGKKVAGATMLGAAAVVAVAIGLVLLELWTTFVGTRTKVIVSSVGLTSVLCFVMVGLIGLRLRQLPAKEIPAPRRSNRRRRR